VPSAIHQFTSLDDPPTWITLSTGLFVVRLRHLSYYVPTVAQSIALHDADDIWAVELHIEFEIVSAPVHTVYYFWTIYCGENFPLNDE
jgi:hypothetical protein